ILNFSWTPGQTLGSTPQFLTLTILTYLLFTLLLPHLLLSFLPLGPHILKPITALHSLTLFLLSSVMAAGATLSILSSPTTLTAAAAAVCFPPQTPPSGPLFFWAHVFYLSKILEFLDTLLIILGGDSARRRLTFLHVYHHATVVLMCYLWLHTSQSLFPVALVTNAAVHVLMYFYYLSCAVGIRPKWKRLVTDCQIVQFVFSFCISGLMLYYHFAGSGCSGIWGWCFNAVFNASLLALFVDFHGKSYAVTMDFLFQTVKYWVVHRLSDYPPISTLQYWLVNNPTISNFHWSQGQTLGSSPLFLALTVSTYLSLTLLLSHISIPSVPSPILRALTALHNLVLLALSLTMAIGCSLSIVFHAPNVEYIICYPRNTQPKGPLFFWSNIFYLSKIVEYVDTLLIILSKSRRRRLTFLHVYHHATVVVMCYISMATSQSLFPGVLVINSTVHVIMYFYYFLCAIGIRPKWKKFVTDCQIVQFFSSFAIMAWIFFYHFSGSGCSGIWGWCFDAVFIASLLVLFLDFHSKNYSNKVKGDKDTLK
ncbi:hypothetical protein Tsubulata_037196, partial [Turnera subulata]